MAIVIWLSSMDTKEKRLDKKARKHYRLVTIIISAVMYTVAVGLAWSGWATPLFVVATAGVFVLENVLLVAGKVQCVNTSVCIQ